MRDALIAGMNRAFGRSHSETLKVVRWLAPNGYCAVAQRDVKHVGIAWIPWNLMATPPTFGTYEHVGVNRHSNIARQELSRLWHGCPCLRASIDSDEQLEAFLDYIEAQVAKPNPWRFW